jgi:hypothetical protein
MYIEMGTSDANPVSGPRSHLSASIQSIYRKNISTSASITQKYDGGTAESSVNVNNMITRYES